MYAKNTYDYIVIGAGTAGGVIAKKLSDLPWTISYFNQVNELLAAVSDIEDKNQIIDLLD
ncbi:hypothetical protein [Metabacillus sp. RGM 3146]|uniref:hypothetical protein n=1 Tax=Metabacillus sp. RGM 3146 TaxID=3401092 RepID=UPI003B99FD2A